MCGRCVAANVWFGFFIMPLMDSCSLHEQITKERDVNNFLKKHRAWLSKLKQSKTRQREESEEVSAAVCSGLRHE